MFFKRLVWRSQWNRCQCRMSRIKPAENIQILKFWGYFCTTVKKTINACLRSRGHFLCLCFPCSYALPTKSTEVLLMQEQGTKMYADAILKTHERVVQVSPARRLMSQKASQDFLQTYTRKYFFFCLCSWAVQMLLCVQFWWRFC